MELVKLALLWRCVRTRADVSEDDWMSRVRPSCRRGGGILNCSALRLGLRMLRRRARRTVRSEAVPLVPHRLEPAVRAHPAITFNTGPKSGPRQRRSREQTGTFPPSPGHGLPSTARDRRTRNARRLPAKTPGRELERPGRGHEDPTRTATAPRSSRCLNSSPPPHVSQRRRYG